MSVLQRSPVPVSRARRVLAIAVGKVTRAALRRAGKGNGTSLPGMVALAIDRSVLAGLAAQIPGGSVVVTGTNGKGTTCRMLTVMMRAAGMRPILNREGSNQPSGLATTLLAEARLTGRLAAGERAAAVLRWTRARCRKSCRRCLGRLQGRR